MGRKSNEKKQRRASQQQTQQTQYTTEDLKDMSEEELQAILAEPVLKGEVIDLVRNLMDVKLDDFRKLIAEPLRVMSIQNLALIELAKDKGLIETEADLVPYFHVVRERINAEAKAEAEAEVQEAYAMAQDLSDKGGTDHDGTEEEADKEADTGDGEKA